MNSGNQSPSGKRAEMPEFFHPLVREWFLNKYDHPTDIQSLAWPVIAGGKNILLTAPTGSGKTLTAFLWAIDAMLRNPNERGRIRVIYISPLKALNNDIRINLTAPLIELEELFAEKSERMVPIRTATRSGDTPQSERAKMLRNPPEILITTPESLNILLSSSRTVGLFSAVQSIILDEVHALCDSKRGVHLITAIERLSAHVTSHGSPDFQRIALSATIRSPEVVANFVSGFQANGERRPIEIVQSRAKKEREISVEFPDLNLESGETDEFWRAICLSMKEKIKRNRSTLVFANSRRLAEKLSRLLNEGEEEPLSLCHHGSLSREIRLAVEKRLKAGTLRAIVATGTLELGIDIGSVDEVIMVQTPFAVSSALQRIGRAGHGVGQISKGTLIPTHGRDLLDAVVVARCMQDANLEETTVIRQSLDVLSQVVVSQACAAYPGELNPDDAFSILKTSESFHDLERKQFDLVIDMLTGRYAETRIRELKPRLTMNRLTGMLQKREGAELVLYMAGGTIPDRGYFDLRIEGDNSKVGELDEEFVWERRIGETFSLGNAYWRILKITHNDVMVTPGKPGEAIVPFWKAEEVDRSFHLSHEVGLFLEKANDRLDDPAFVQEIQENHFTNEQTAKALIEFLQKQKDATRSDLPHATHILVEHVVDSGREPNQNKVIFYTLWGGRVNRPLSLAIRAAWRKKFGYPITVISNNDALLLVLPEGFAFPEILALLDSHSIEELLRDELESSGFFGARFRENAARALLLPPSGFNRRMPLWFNRVRGRKLLEAVDSYRDFPVTLETWRTCLKDEFDMETLGDVLDQVRSGQIRVTEVTTGQTSPFGSGLIYKETNTLMYGDDSGDARTSSLDDQLLAGIISGDGTSNPHLTKELLLELNSRLQRSVEGLAPVTQQDVVEWVKERLLIPKQEWIQLEKASGRNYDFDLTTLTVIRLPGAQTDCIIALENIPRVLSAVAASLEDCKLEPIRESTQGHRQFVESQLNSMHVTPVEIPLEILLLQFLSFYGPVNPSFPESIFGTSTNFTNLIESEVVKRNLLRGNFIAGETGELICDPKNLQILIRRSRDQARRSIEPLPLSSLPLFLATHQKLIRASDSSNEDALSKQFEHLHGYPLPVSVWPEALSARGIPLSILRQGLIWFGSGKKNAAFCHETDLELFPIEQPAENLETLRDKIFGGTSGRYTTLDLLGRTGMSYVDLYSSLWSLGWAGLATSDSSEFERAVQSDFKPQPDKKVGFRSRRPAGGLWWPLNRVKSSDRTIGDAVTDQEIIGDRVRLLMERYAILFREILTREMPAFRWANIFRKLRLMELSGEIRGGYFFKGIPGLQFLSPAGLRAFHHGLKESSIYWMNSFDPASLCGLNLGAANHSFDKPLPKRSPGTHLVYHGTRLVVVSSRRGRDLQIHSEPQNPHLREYLHFFSILLSAGVFSRVTVERINGKPFRDSEYLEALEGVGFRSDYKSLNLYRT